MTSNYVVEIRGQLYGPFSSNEKARYWAIHNADGDRYIVHLLYDVE